LATSGVCPADESDYDAQDRLIGCGNTTFTYTANGELSSKTESGVGTTEYVYDVLGNLLRVSLPSGTLVEYVIDGENRRVGKKVNGVVVARWLYRDGLKPVAELNGAGALVSQFVYASSPNEPDYVVKSGTKFRIVKDQLGSVRLVINVATGAVAQMMRHDAWGNVLQDSNPGFVPFGFAGALYDPDTGLSRFGARDYDPKTGRWTAKDPMGFGGNQRNVFAYVGGDPINATDRTGLGDLPGEWDNGVVDNRSDRPILVYSDTVGVKVLMPDEVSDKAVDTDFVIDGSRVTKVGPNYVTVQTNGIVVAQNVDLIPGHNVEPWTPADGPMPNHHPDPWGRPMCVSY
jgi:RHS repeat-associated protein